MGVWKHGGLGSITQPESQDRARGPREWGRFNHGNQVPW